MTKPLPKPISLNGLKFSNDRGKFVVAEDHFLTFRDKEALEKFINSRHKFWQELLDMKLTFMEDSQETLAEIEVYKVLKLVALKLGVPIEKAMNESTKDAVEARRLTIKLCIDKQVRIGIIGKALCMPHDLVIHHKKQFNNYHKTSNAYRDQFIEIDDYVFSTMYGRFVDDGSGKRPKKEE